MKTLARRYPAVTVSAIGGAMVVGLLTLSWLLDNAAALITG